MLKRICCLLFFIVVIAGCSTFNEELNTDKELVSIEEQKESYLEFYDNIYKFVNNLEDIDETINNLENQNSTKLQLYESFKKIRDLMEEGQKIPFGSFVPSGFSQNQEETLNMITTNLNNAFQYRKFAYDHYLQYLDSGSLKAADESKEWLKSAHSSLQSTILNLEVFKMELGITDETSPIIGSISEDANTNQNVDENNNYKVVYTLTTKRFDKGINFYVLLDPVDLSDPAFEGEIKLIIDEMVNEKGGKISIEFHDNIESLELSYKLYGDMSLDRNTTQDENEFLAIHHIAAFSGDLSTGLYNNTLYFFPNTDSNNKTVGEFVSIEEYNPPALN